MELFPNAKINLGLNVLQKRQDGYHDIETVFYPVFLTDRIVLEENKELRVTFSGIKIEGVADDNLVLKAYQTMKNSYQLPPVSIHLEKRIPTGAGLGGGSSDCAYIITGLNQLFNLKLSQSKMQDIASTLGSDCAFFIENKPAIATGRGEILSPISLSLKGYQLVLVKPDLPISTKEAYSGVVPGLPAYPLKKAILEDVNEWKHTLFNSFESTILKNHPTILTIKTKLNQMGAVYSAMSGSGSTVYGIFNHRVNHVAREFPGMFVYEEPCAF